jgi:hypothetical protein
MNFKVWFKLSETLDPQTKGSLERDKAPPTELAAFIKELEDDPSIIDRKDAFIRLRQRFPLIKQKPEKEEKPVNPKILPYFEKLKTNQITKNEFKIAEFYQNENESELKETMNLIRTLVQENKININFTDKPVIKHKEDIYKDPEDFNHFTSFIHSIVSSESVVDNYDDVFQNPIALAAKYPNLLVAKGDNVWVFKANKHIDAHKFGKKKDRSSGWCVTWDNPSYFMTYRMEYQQTQYFVFDYNKGKDDPARYVNPGVAPEGKYSEWVDAENNSRKGIEGYGTDTNAYMQYLSTLGINPNVFKAEPITKEERLLKVFIESSNFEMALRHPEIINDYLIMCNIIDLEQFDELTTEQKSLVLKYGEAENKLRLLVPKAIQNQRDDVIDFILANVKIDIEFARFMMQHAVNSEDVDTVKKLVETVKQKLPQELVNLFSYFSISRGVKDKNYKIIDIMLGQPEALESLQTTIDMYETAAINNETDVLKYLKEKVPMRISDMANVNAIRGAAQHNAYDAFCYLFKELKKPIDEYTDLLRKVMSDAAIQSLEILRFLLNETKPSVNILNNAVYSTLITDNVQTAKMLFDAGASNYELIFLRACSDDNYEDPIGVVKYIFWVAPESIHKSSIEQAFENCKRAGPWKKTKIRKLLSQLLGHDITQI